MSDVDETLSGEGVAVEAGLASVQVLAKLFECDERTVRNLASEGIVVRAGRGQYVVSTSIINYIRHLRDVAAGRGGGDAQANLTRERARFAAEQADNAAMKNQVMRGTLLEASVVKSRWAAIASSIRSFMLAIPGQIAQKLPHLTRADIDIIDRSIRDALNAAANEIGAD